MEKVILVTVSTEYDEDDEGGDDSSYIELLDYLDLNPCVTQYTTQDGGI